MSRDAITTEKMRLAMSNFGVSCFEASKSFKRAQDTLREFSKDGLTASVPKVRLAITGQMLRDQLAAIQSVCPPMPILAYPRLIPNKLCEARPRMTLSAKAAAIVTPEFRAEMDAWMLEFFGTEDVSYQFADPYTGQDTIVTSQRVIDKMIAAGLAP